MSGNTIGPEGPDLGRSPDGESALGGSDPYVARARSIGPDGAITVSEMNVPDSTVAPTNRLAALFGSDGQGYVPFTG